MSGSLSYPYGIAVDNNGDIYVSDLTNYIHKFNSSGVFLKKWGGTGSGDGQFNYPTHIAIDNTGNVYVCDQENDRVQKFTSEGIFLKKWGSKGTSNGQFDTPKGIEIDGNNNVYVVDNFNRRVQKFNNDGVFQSKFGSTGSDDGLFQNPQGIAIDLNGNIFVADWINLTQKFDFEGNYSLSWGTDGSADKQFIKPQGISCDRQGNIYVADRGNFRIQKFDSQLNLVTKWGSPGSGPGQFGDEVGKIGGPLDITVDNNGVVYVTDIIKHRIQIFKEETPTGLSSNVTSNIKFEVFPNPSSGQSYIYIQDEAAISKLIITDINGRVYYENSEVSTNSNFMLPELPSGMYFVKVNGKETSVKKLIRY